MGVASPFFRSLPIKIPWIEPAAPCAHPLDDGTAVLLEHPVEDTVPNLEACDGRKYRSLLEPLVERFPELIVEILGPIPRIPQNPFLLARFGLSAVLPAASLARSRFMGVRARALFCRNGGSLSFVIGGFSFLRGGSCSDGFWARQWLAHCSGWC
jgi:phytoene dehydrogenase-like protein